MSPGTQEWVQIENKYMSIMMELNQHKFYHQISVYMNTLLVHYFSKKRMTSLENEPKKLKFV